MYGEPLSLLLTSQAHTIQECVCVRVRACVCTPLRSTLVKFRCILAVLSPSRSFFLHQTVASACGFSFFPLPLFFFLLDQEAWCGFSVCLLEGTSAEGESKQGREGERKKPCAYSWVKKPQNPDAVSQTSAASEGLNCATSDVIRDTVCVHVCVLRPEFDFIVTLVWQ